MDWNNILCDIWLDRIRRIASFQQKDGYELCSFANHTEFQCYTQMLQNFGYRFQ